MKMTLRIEFLSAAEVLSQYEVEDMKETYSELKKLAKGEDYNPLVFKELETFDLYYCNQHNIFHSYYYETDDGDIYTAASQRPVCPLCLFNLSING